MLKRFVEKIAGNKTLMLLVMGYALLASVFIDSRNSIVAPSDMRNRIVGSRMMEDGLSPYYYIWKEGGPVRYYDTHTMPTSLVSAATATPFFHWMITPAANLLQHQLNVFWFCLCYGMLGACWLLMALATPPPRRKKLLLLTAIAIAFTYTTGWRMHLTVGQNYIFIPVMMAGCYYCFTQKKDWLHLLLFGLFAACLLLLRPLAAILFVPFLFYLKNYIQWFISAAVWLAAYAVFVLLSPVQQKNWQEYFSSIKVNVLLHQDIIKTPLPSYPYNEIPITSYEGVDFNSRGNEYWAMQVRKGVENSNFYILYENLFGYKPNVAVQTGLGLFICLVLLAPLWWVKKKRLPAPVEMLLLLGFLLYNTYEFFSPINRGNYVFVEFIFPLLLLVLYIRQFYLIPIALLLLGFYLNIAVLPTVVMEHNIGQCLMVIAILWLVYRDLIINSFLKQKKLRLNGEILWA